jgi:hypothetical protein
MGVPSENDGTVLSAKLDGSDVQTVIPSGQVHTPKQLHIDQTAKKLYFCDREGLRVMRSNLDGSEHETLIETGDWKNEPDKAALQHNWPVVIQEKLPECIDLEMDDESGFLFWTDRGELPLGNTLNKKQIFGEAPAAEKPLGRQIVSHLTFRFRLRLPCASDVTDIQSPDCSRTRRRHWPQI